MTGAILGAVPDVELDIACDADECYRLLCDVERLPEWVPTVTGVRVLDTDEQGRATRVWFIGGAGSAAYSYRLRYHYDEARRALGWQIEETTLRDLDGEAEVSPIGPRRCRLRYRLHASLLLLSGGQVRLRDESPEQIAEAFRRWAEKMTIRTG